MGERSARRAGRIGSKQIKKEFLAQASFETILRRVALQRNICVNRPLII
jgi:hypothetical protein